MAENKINLPSGFGGLTRFKEEYKSSINLKPTHVIIFVLFVIGFRILLEFIY